MNLACASSDKPSTKSFWAPKPLIERGADHAGEKAGILVEERVMIRYAGRALATALICGVTFPAGALMFTGAFIYGKLPNGRPISAVAGPEELPGIPASGKPIRVIKVGETGASPSPDAPLPAPTPSPAIPAPAAPAPSAPSLAPARP